MGEVLRGSRTDPQTMGVLQVKLWVLEVGDGGWRPGRPWLRRASEPRRASAASRCSWPPARCCSCRPGGCRGAAMQTREAGGDDVGRLHVGL